MEYLTNIFLATVNAFLRLVCLANRRSEWHYWLTASARADTHTHTHTSHFSAWQVYTDRDNGTTNLDLMSIKIILHFTGFVTFTDSRYKNYKWPISPQVHRSQHVARTYKRQMFVKYTSRRNAIASAAKRTAAQAVYNTLWRRTAPLIYRFKGIFAINYTPRISNHALFLYVTQDWVLFRAPSL